MKVSRPTGVYTPRCVGQRACPAGHSVRDTVGQWDGTPTNSDQEPTAGKLFPIEIRAQLATIAAVNRIDTAIVHDLHGDDLTACRGLPSAVLRDWLRAQDFGRMMDRGIPPPGYCKPVECSGCGPVLLWSTCPDRVIACPWCFRRKAGKAIPRPSTTRERCA